MDSNRGYDNKSNNNDNSNNNISLSKSTFLLLIISGLSTTFTKPIQIRGGSSFLS